MDSVRIESDLTDLMIKYLTKFQVDCQGVDPEKAQSVARDYVMAPGKDLPILSVFYIPSP